jgi:F0F1-type ATP synthase assembly protein I
MEPNANIPQFSRPTPLGEALKREIRRVLWTMLALVLAIAVAALFIAGAVAALAALMGGLSMVAAVLVQSRVLRHQGIPHPKAMFAQILVAELVKVVVALILLVIGLHRFGTHAAWFLAAFVAALAAYLLVLLFKTHS